MADGAQRAQWIAMRRVATGLLLFMGLLLLVAHRLESQPSTWSPVWPYIAAFAEAALVGGLADWFAVTALFRQPLGLPIPHTAILPTHKNRLADSIAGFIEHNFFTAGVVAGELARVDFAAILGDALAHPRRRRWLARHLLQSLTSLSSLLSDAQVKQSLRQSLRVVLDQLLTPQRLANGAAAILSAMVAQQRHIPLFDRTLVLISTLIEENQWLIYEKVTDKTPGWMPRYLKDEIFRRLMSGLDELLAEMRQPDSPWHASFTASLQSQIDQMRDDEALGHALREHLRAVANDPSVMVAAAGLWEGLLSEMKGDGEWQEDTPMGRADAVIVALGTALLQDTRRRTWMNDQIRSRLGRAVIARRSRILGVIRRVMHAWDAPTVVGAIEAYVGRDLQYIRVNGTLVGGTVGLVLHILQNLF